MSLASQIRAARAAKKAEREARAATDTPAREHKFANKPGQHDSTRSRGRKPSKDSVFGKGVTPKSTQSDAIAQSASMALNNIAHGRNPIGVTFGKLKTGE